MNVKSLVGASSKIRISGKLEGYEDYLQGGCIDDMSLGRRANFEAAEGDAKEEEFP